MTISSRSLPSRDLAATAIPGLDDVLSGGLTRRRLYLLEGIPGSGKTTLALQFLMAGVKNGESVVYITLSESEEELREMSASHGWQLDGIPIRELKSEEQLDPDEQYTMFRPSEVELNATMKGLFKDINALKPDRAVLDSLSELRLLSNSPLKYRRQIMALKQFLSSRGCTVLFLDDMTAGDNDRQMQSLAHGVIRLDQSEPEYGSQRRRLHVIKMRGVRYRGGYHDYVIKTGGLEVYPRLVASEHRTNVAPKRISTGVADLDALTGGGLETGTSTLIVGAAGTGKSTIAAQIAAAAAGRGESARFYMFDESPVTLLTRCDSVGVDLRRHVETGRVQLRQIDPAELSPGELTHSIRDGVEDEGVRIVVIDSLNGYLNAMPEERYLTLQLHELLMYLGQVGVASVLVGAHQGLIGSTMQTPVDASYLADAVVLLRYFEISGEVRQAISVIKKRGGQHERTIREFRFDRGGIHLGPPLTELRGVLTGVPVIETKRAPKAMRTSGPKHARTP